jgi:hypothetical protein
MHLPSPSKAGSTPPATPTSRDHLHRKSDSLSKGAFSSRSTTRIREAAHFAPWRRGRHGRTRASRTPPSVSTAAHTASGLSGCQGARPAGSRAFGMTTCCPPGLSGCQGRRPASLHPFGLTTCCPPGLSGCQGRRPASLHPFGLTTWASCRRRTGQRDRDVDVG